MSNRSDIPDSSALRKARIWLWGMGSFFAVSLFVIASLYTALAVKGVRYDGFSGIPTWMNAAGYWGALVLLLVFFGILLKSINPTD